MADLQLLPQQAEVARWIIEAPPEERIMVLVGAVRSVVRPGPLFMRSYGIPNATKTSNLSVAGVHQSGR